MTKRSIAVERELVKPMSERDEVRLGMMLGNAVIHAGQSRNTAYRNRTLGDLIDAFLNLGIRLDDEIGMVDFGAGENPSGYLIAERGHDGQWEVREVKRGLR